MQIKGYCQKMRYKHGNKMNLIEYTDKSTKRYSVAYTRNEPLYMDRYHGTARYYHISIYRQKCRYCIFCHTRFVLYIVIVRQSTCLTTCCITWFDNVKLVAGPGSRKSAYPHTRPTYRGTGHTGIPAYQTGIPDKRRIPTYQTLHSHV